VQFDPVVQASSAFVTTTALAGMLAGSLRPTNKEPDSTDPRRATRVRNRAGTLESGRQRPGARGPRKLPGQRPIFAIHGIRDSALSGAQCPRRWIGSDGSILASSIFDGGSLSMMISTEELLDTSVAQLRTLSAFLDEQLYQRDGRPECATSATTACNEILQSLRGLIWRVRDICPAP